MASRNKARGTWLYEKDGSLNPLFLVFCIFALVIVSGVVVGFVVAARGGSQNLAIAGLAAAVTGMLATAITAVPLAKAKLLARGLGPSAGSITAAGGGGPAMLGIAVAGYDNPLHDDESDE